MCPSILLGRQCQVLRATLALQLANIAYFYLIQLVEPDLQ